MIRTLSEIAENRINPITQEQLSKPDTVLKTAPKINPEFCIITGIKILSQ